MRLSGSKGSAALIVTSLCCNVVVSASNLRGKTAHRMLYEGSEGSQSGGPGAPFNGDPYVPEVPVLPFPGWSNLQQIFPSLPGTSLVSDASNAPAEAGLRTLEQLGERARQQLGSMLLYQNSVTLDSETRPTTAWFYDLAAFPASLPKEQHRPLESPEQFSRIGYSSPEFATLSQDLIDRWAAFFTDSTVAEDDFWPAMAGAVAGGTPVFNQVTLLKKVPEEAYQTILPYLPAGELDLGYEYYTIDTSSMGLVPPHLENDVSLTRYGVGALIVLRKEGEGEQLKPSAVIISTNQGTFPPASPRDIVTKLFNPSISSPSAWRLALLAARASITQWGVVVGHVLPYHITTGAFQAALLNTVDPDHPLHQFLAPFTRYTMQFNTLFLGNIVGLDAFPYENDAPNLGNMVPVLNAWQEYIKDTPYPEMAPPRFFAKNGIEKEDFSIECESKPSSSSRSGSSSSSSSGSSSDFEGAERLECGDWSLFPFARLSVNTYNLAAAFVDEAVSAMYTKDCHVANDSQLQAMVSELTSPGGGNLKAVTSSGKVETLEELKEFLATYFYLVFIHGAGRVSRLLPQSAPPNIIASLMNVDFLSDNDGRDYSLSEVMAVMPNTNVLKDLIEFINFFEVTPPYEPLVPKGGPEADLLFRGEEFADQWNAALVELRRGVAQLVEDLPNLEGVIDVFPLEPGSDINQWPQNAES